MNDTSANPGDTEFVLPIVCPHCSKEINLAMGFTLLPPEKQEDLPPPIAGEEEQ